MKQIIQDLHKGNTILEEVPVPLVRTGAVLIRTTRSLISLGTERMLVDFGKAGFIAKARQQPDKVKQVIDKIKTEGFKSTLDAVFNKLNQPIPLGYCNVGVVQEVGKNVKDFKAGDRVASNGNHAEFVCVPSNLVAKIPDNVSDDDATFTVIGSIALEGVRLCNPTFGETIVVIGLGLVGLISSQILKANGCNVIGYDFDQSKVDIAAAKGIAAFNPVDGIDPVNFVMQHTKNTGADGVIITASNSSDEIIHQAALMSRKRGRIVLIGVVGLNIRRDDFYKKELSFQVSCSYGPGRYDDNYENKGEDYPIGYVRWTEKRNFEAILNAISDGLIDLHPLITEKIPLEDFGKVYDNMHKHNVIASILTYPEKSERQTTIEVFSNKYKPSPSCIMGIVGAGNFTSSTVIPSLKSLNADVKIIASAGGLSAKLLAKKGNIKQATSDYHKILEDPEVNTAIITTRHDLHAIMTLQALKAGKNVLVEKPLCLNEEQLGEIVKEQRESGKIVIVGYNRRFAPLAVKMKKTIGEGPVNIIATMNAGFIPEESWVQDLKVGGGRIIGEACHFIDLCTYLSGCRVKAVCMNSMGIAPKENTDNVTILLKYENGSNASINYFANGSKSYPKERIEVYVQGKTLILDNWRKLKLYGVNGKDRVIKKKLDKGHVNLYKEYIDSVKKGLPLIPFEDII
ncbi:MAG: bi-domain-containing oxidoreductase, partial [Bacteroidales bacterium]|nr:bi-domain-containing oxidoreductase [Bacteroidales bacterium]